MYSMLRNICSHSTSFFDMTKQLLTTIEARIDVVKSCDIEIQYFYLAKLQRSFSIE